MSEAVSALGGKQFEGFATVEEIGPIGMITLRGDQKLCRDGGGGQGGGGSAGAGQAADRAVGRDGRKLDVAGRAAAEPAL